MSSATSLKDSNISFQAASVRHSSDITKSKSGLYTPLRALINSKWLSPVHWTHSFRFWSCFSLIRCCLYLLFLLRSRTSINIRADLIFPLQFVTKRLQHIYTMFSVWKIFVRNSMWYIGWSFFKISNKQMNVYEMYA